VRKLQQRNLCGQNGSVVLLAAAQPIRNQHRRSRVQSCACLQAAAGAVLLPNNRTKPDWGEAMDWGEAEHCVITRPQAALADVIKYATAVTRMHLQLARLAMPVQTNRCDA